MNEQTYIRKVQGVVLVASLLLLIVLSGTIIRKGAIVDWRDYQNEFKAIVSEVEDSLEIRASFEKGIYQIELDHFNRIDRCISCHNGLENPLMATAAQPHTLHPGDFLEQHPPQKFGCTICHGGQGRALTQDEAFGLDPAYHWDAPLLYQPYIQASCGKCHLAIYNADESLEGTDVFREGQAIFTREGCLGCHKARAVGGIIGPDLTEQGEKTKHEYSFQNIQGEQTISNWLKEHFKDPEMVSPGSQMLKIDLPEDELDALATFVMGLAKPDIPVDYFGVATLNELKGNRRILVGEEVYAFTCSACHGKHGKGKDYKTYEMGVPAVMNRDFLRVASEDFIMFTLLKGRSLRDMSSWAPDLSGWRQEEMERLVEHLEDAGRKAVSSGEEGEEGEEGEGPVTDISFRGRGNSMDGETLFADLCATCHGDQGRGGAAIALQQEDLVRRAGRRFIGETIIKGRNGAGMPAWSHLDQQEINDLLAYFGSWYRMNGGDLPILLPEGDTAEGALRYHFLCSRCHGDFGEGETGPAIFDRDFLAAASDRYLYETIAEGRAHTAMFGWSTDVYNEERLERKDIADIIDFMRQQEKIRQDYIYPGSNPGDKTSGQTLFRQRCAECHGEQGEGKEAPALNNQEFLSAASNGYLVATLTIGREGTRMPSWGYPDDAYPMLSGKERQDIAAHIRSWQRIRIKY